MFRADGALLAVANTSKTVSLTRARRCLDAQESARAWQEARDYISSIKAQMLKH